MEPNPKSSSDSQSKETKVERISDLELKVSRVIDAPVEVVFEAWTNSDIFRQWWVPKSYGLHLDRCELDARQGGKYRLVFLHEGAEMEFFGTYLEVVPSARLVWTNDEGEAGQSITTVTFEACHGQTLLVVCERFANIDAVETGSIGAMPEVILQLVEIVTELQAGR